MGLIQQIEETLLNKLKQLLAPVIGPLERLWNILKGMVTAIIDVIPETISLVKLIYSEVQEWRQFRNNVSFSGGVINLQSVRDRISDLVQEFVSSWHALVDLFTHGFKQGALKPFTDAADAAAELAEVFGGLERLGLADFLKSIGPKLEKAGGKIFEVIAIVEVIAEDILRMVREIHTIVQTAKDVRELLQHGEGLFLSQKNKRRKVDLADGGSFKIRVGNLH